MDENLRFSHHINWVYKKIQASLALILRSKKTLTFKIKLLLYNSLIMSHINYGSCIWGGASETELSKLETPMKKAIRAVCSAKYNQHATPLFYQCATLKLKDYIELNFLKLGNSLYHGFEPNPVQELFIFYRNKRTRLGAFFQLKVPDCSKRLQSATSYTLPKTWNDAIKKYRLNLQTRTPALVKNFKAIQYNSKCYVCH